MHSHTVFLFAMMLPGPAFFFTFCRCGLMTSSDVGDSLFKTTITVLCEFYTASESEGGSVSSSVVAHQDGFVIVAVRLLKLVCDCTLTKKSSPKPLACESSTVTPLRRSVK